jgi:tRNA threonylcarbamoyladenosine modification (KEOPS) complex Cgi121 subunit
MMADDLRTARIKKKTNEIVERARHEYGDNSPEVASAKRVAFATFHAITHRHPE